MLKSISSKKLSRKGTLTAICKVVELIGWRSVNACKLIFYLAECMFTVGRVGKKIAGKTHQVQLS